MAAMEAAADAMLAAASRAFSSAFAIAIQIQVSPLPLRSALWLDCLRRRGIVLFCLYVPLEGQFWPAENFSILFFHQ